MSVVCQGPRSSINILLCAGSVDYLRERVNCHASWQPALRCGCCRFKLVTVTDLPEPAFIEISHPKSSKGQFTFPKLLPPTLLQFDSLFLLQVLFFCLTSLFYGDSVVVDYSCATKTITKSSSEVITIVDSILSSRALFIIIDRQRPQFNRICHIYHILHVR